MGIYDLFAKGLSMNPLTSQKFWQALQAAVTALVLVAAGIWWPSQLDNITKLVAAINGVILVFIIGYATPEIISMLRAKAK